MARIKVIIVPLILILLVFLGISYVGLPLSSSAYPQLALSSEDRVLIIAPHPDDETICSGGLINHCKENNIPVKVVILTDGDFYKGLSAQRYNETINATQILGLAPEDLILFGYPDGSLDYLFKINWKKSRPYKTSQGNTKVNHSYAWKPNQTICGENLENNLQEIINEFQPTIIIGPDGEDQQIDHKAAQGFTTYTTHRMNYNGSYYEYLLHLAPAWPYPRSYHPEYYLMPPSELKEDNNWLIVPLNSSEIRTKEKALRSYTSQVGLNSYLLSFVRRNELFNQPPESSLYPGKSLIISEPLQDDKNQIKWPEQDIKSMRLGWDSQYLTLHILTKKSIPPNSIYKIHLITPGPIPRSIHLKMEEGKLSSIDFGHNSTPLLGKIDINIKENLLELKIPLQNFKVNEYLMIGVETFRGPELVDQTSWRAIKLIDPT